MKVTVVSTEFPVPLSGQLSVNGPAPVGVKVTDSVTDCPAWMVVPSASWVVAVNSPSPGGFDLVMESGVPPTLVTTKVAVEASPTGTVP